MKKKLLSIVVTVVMMVSCVSEAGAVFVDGSATNGEGVVNNVLTYEELFNNDAVLIYDVEKEEDDTIIASSPTNGDGEIKQVIVVDTDLMPLTSYTDVELPANSVMYFSGEWVSDVLLTVIYKPTNVAIYYGMAEKNDGTGNHYANRATGGTGSATISLPSREWLYPYLANGNSKTVYVDFVYTYTVDLRMQNENPDEPLATEEMIGNMAEENRWQQL